MQVVAECAEANIPVLFFCKVGKVSSLPSKPCDSFSENIKVVLSHVSQDRTGLLATMVLACCGATDHEIISDYAR